MPDTPELQIIISSGPEDARATLGFAAATAAVASGTRVVIFLVMRGTQWAFKSVGNEPQQAGFQSVSEMLDVIQSAGGTVEICSTCVANTDSMCQAPGNYSVRNSDCSPELRPGIHSGGLTSVAIRMTQIPTVTF